MRNLNTTFYVGIAAASVVMSACQPEGRAERAGRSLDYAAHQTIEQTRPPAGKGVAVNGEPKK
jgi:hypothetical protein